MAERTYTIGEVAELLGVAGKNSSTVRLWSETFADWLSPSARPKKGQLRLYTEGDVRLLRTIRDLRRQHFSYDEVRSRFKSGNYEVGKGEGQENPEDGQRAEGPPVVVKVEDLRQVLAPFLEVADGLGGVLRELDSTRMRLEFARLTASLESLENRLAKLQEGAVSLPPSHPTAISQKTHGVLGDGSGGKSGPSQVEARRSPAPDDDDSDLGFQLELRAAAQPRNVVPAPEDGNVIHSPSALLNEYGLRPLPARLSGHPLGALHRCPHCGSRTNPLGITPTARVVLSCVNCHGRMVVPLSEIEKDLGRPRGFWARVWSFLSKPFS